MSLAVLTVFFVSWVVGLVRALWQEHVVQCALSVGCDMAVAVVVEEVGKLAMAEPGNGSAGYTKLSGCHPPTSRTHRLLDYRTTRIPLLQPGLRDGTGVRIVGMNGQTRTTHPRRSMTDSPRIVREPLSCLAWFDEALHGVGTDRSYPSEGSKSGLLSSFGVSIADC